MVACGGKTDLSGRWRTGFGTLNLTQKGDSLVGEFEGGGKNDIGSFVYFLHPYGFWFDKG
jgi:hypothetical protein